MATTGVGFNAIVDNKSDRSFSQYFSTAKKNMMIAEATIILIDKLIATNDRQRIKDELFSLYWTNIQVTPVNNQISLINQLLNYHSLMDLKVFMTEYISQPITAASIGSPIKCTIAATPQNNLRTGDYISISGVLGNTLANGNRYISMINKTQFNLYADAKLTIPITGFLPYTSGGIIKRYVVSWTQDATQKTSKLGEPSLYYPDHEIANAVIKILPQDVPCSVAYIDFVSKPANFIDVADNTYNIELDYSLRMIDNLADEVCLLMANSSRDGGLQQNSVMQINQP